MKVRDLIEALSKADPDLTVCQFTDNGPEEIMDVGVFGGAHLIDTSPKMIWGRAEGLYAAIGNPGDFELTASDHDCHSLKDLTADGGTKP